MNGDGVNGAAPPPERESAGRYDTQAVIVPTQRHFDLYQLLLATSRQDAAGRLVSWWPQTKLAAKLGVSVRTLQNLLADLREPGGDPRHRRSQPAGRRLGLLLVTPTTRKDPATGGRLYAGNLYVLTPGRHATLPEPVSPVQHDTQEENGRSVRHATVSEPVSAGRYDTQGVGVACLNKERHPAGGGYQGRDEGEHESPASRQPAVVPAALEVGHQREPSWADLRLTRDQIIDQLRGQLGQDAELLGVVADDDDKRDAKLRATHGDRAPPSSGWSPRRRLSYRPAGQNGTRRPPLRLTGDVDDFHAAVDALEADSVPESYYRKVVNGRRPHDHT